MWTKVIESPQFQLKPGHFGFFFRELLPSALNESVRMEAIRAIKATVPHLHTLDYRNDVNYKAFLDKSITEYMPKLKADIENIQEWATIWCLYLTVVRKDMARSIQINAFLSVAESGFRSNNIEMRTKSFVCWRKLIEIFASEGQLHNKRVRLITVPLQTTASKTVELATAKFSCWWYLVNSICPDSSEDHTKCFNSFLNFCFGPLNGIPLDGYVKSSTAVSPGKLYTELKLTVIVALIRIIGPANSEVLSLKLDRPMDDLKPVLNPGKVFPLCRRELVHCCAEATVLTYSVAKLTKAKQAVLTKNIWDNLFAMVKLDDKITKTTILIEEAVCVIIQLSSDPPRKALSHCIPVFFQAARDAKFNLKGAHTLTEFSLSMFRTLIAATKVLEDDTVEQCFNDYIDSSFKGIILLDNKINFVAALAKELMQDKAKSNFTIWSLMWSKLLCGLDKGIPIHMEFLQFGLENYFNDLVRFL